MQEIWVLSLGQEDLLKKEMVTPSSILAWEIPWTEEPGMLQSMGCKRVRHNLVTKQQQNNRTILRKQIASVQGTPGVTGKFGFGVQNEAGQRLKEFC